MFVGIGRAADVDRYLDGAATDEVTDFNAAPFSASFGIERERHAGSATPAAPGTQAFWLARSSGRTRPRSTGRSATATTASWS